MNSLEGIDPIFMTLDQHHYAASNCNAYRNQSEWREVADNAAKDRETNPTAVRNFLSIHRRTGIVRHKDVIWKLRHTDFP